MPWPLQEAINHGLAILSWYENYIEDEIPPEPIWDDSEAVSEWFKMIKKRNDDRMNNGDPTPSRSSDDEGGEGDNSMMGNDLADYFRG